MSKENALSTLDLHGKTIDEVFDMVDPFLIQHAKKGTRQVRIMSGKGTGAVQKKLIEYLKLAGYQWKFEGSNTGSLIVFVSED